MNKRIIIAILLVYLCWFALDFLIHNIFLADSYAATAQFWRPMEEMKVGLMQVVSVVAASVFVLIYALWFKEHNVPSGLKYGLLYGIGGGIGMGYGMYSVMPIPYVLAISWFLATVVETTVAGLIAGLVIKRT